MYVFVAIEDDDACIIGTNRLSTKADLLAHQGKATGL